MPPTRGKEIQFDATGKVSGGFWGGLGDSGGSDGRFEAGVGGLKAGVGGFLAHGCALTAKGNKMELQGRPQESQRRPKGSRRPQIESQKGVQGRRERRRSGHGTGKIETNW